MLPRLLLLIAATGLIGFAIGTFYGRNSGGSRPSSTSQPSVAEVPRHDTPASAPGPELGAHTAPPVAEDRSAGVASAPPPESEGERIAEIPSSPKSDASADRSDGLAAPSTGANADQVAREILDLINVTRERHGLSPLEESSALDRAALRHSREMADSGNFSHLSPDGSTPQDRLKALRISYVTMGENVYMEASYSPAGLAQRAVNGWLSSPAHRANILSPEFDASGIAIVHGHNGTTYITQDFTRMR